MELPFGKVLDGVTHIIAADDLEGLAFPPIKGVIWPELGFNDEYTGPLGQDYLESLRKQRDHEKLVANQINYDRPTLKMLSINVQGSAANSLLILESYHDYDFIFMQEIYWGFIKCIPLASDPDGDEYHGTSRHRNFMTLGAHEASSVCIHVNKRWEHLMPRLADHVLKHNDVCGVGITACEGMKILINVYNRFKTGEALDYLEHRVDRLPTVFAMAGDFNLHSSIWGPSRSPKHQCAIKRDSSSVARLIEVTSSLNLVVVNDQGKPTWRSHNEVLESHGIDIIWVPMGLRAETKCWITLNDSVINSDHAIMTWEMPLEAV